jgi:translation initiation factor IF-1
MPRRDAFIIDALVVAERAGNVFQVALRNGHMLWVHGGSERRMPMVKSRLGQQVRVELSPFDLSVGRWVGD